MDVGLKKQNKYTPLESQYYPAISRLFSPVVLKDIILNGYSAYFSEVCRNSGLLNSLDLSMPLSQFFDRIYSLLFKNYRNEYIYKNAITNKVLLGRHSLNTASMLTEFRVGSCKADVVILNGTSTVYEIKSEFDSFARLNNQLRAYMQVFDHINIITSLSHVSQLKTFLPDIIGIQVLTDRNTISTIRTSKSNKANIKLDVLFNSLRKEEYITIIKNYYGIVPDVPNTLIYTECKKLFCNIPLEEAHNLTVNILKRRNNSVLLKEFFSVAPDSLSAYGLSLNNNKTKMYSLLSNLEKSIGSILIPKSA
ncbi:MAG: hypothetical protein B6229_03785 [Spirochaetaceae bacterium 4572_7]|nr:MAG: hypothetical protein B6229_03785 [Spirochaetaceae bacterium 4572_7]